MSRRCENGNVGQLLAGLNAPQDESTAAHISAADEFGGENQLFAENIKQGTVYFGVARLPRRTISQCKPASAWASRMRGAPCTAHPQDARCPQKSSATAPT